MVVERLASLNPAFSSGVVEVEDSLHPVTASQEQFFSTDLVILRSPIPPQPVTILSLVTHYCQLKGMLITSDTMTLPPYLMKRGGREGGKKEHFSRNGMLHVMISIAT